MLKSNVKLNDITTAKLKTKSFLLFQKLISVTKQQKTNSEQHAFQRETASQNIPKMQL